MKSTISGCKCSKGYKHRLHFNSIEDSQENLVHPFCITVLNAERKALRLMTFDDYFL